MEKLYYPSDNILKNQNAECMLGYNQNAECMLGYFLNIIQHLFLNHIQSHFQYEETFFCAGSYILVNIVYYLDYNNFIHSSYYILQI